MHNCYFLSPTEVELESIQERYVQVLRSYLQHSSPHNPGRLGELLAHIPEVRNRILNNFILLWGFPCSKTLNKLDDS